MNLEQASGGGRGQELGAGKLGFTVQAVLDFVQGMDHLVAVEQSEHRTPEPDQAVLRAGCRRLPEKRSRLLVVEQDTALGIAQQHAL